MLGQTKHNKTIWSSLVTPIKGEMFKSDITFAQDILVYRNKGNMVVNLG